MKFITRHRADYSAILKLGLPVLIGQLGMIVVSFADNIMVGNYSTAALASASFVNGVFNTAMFCCMGFTYGITPIVGALFTQKRSASIGSTVKTALVLNCIYSAIIIAIMTAVYLNLERLGQPVELLPLIRPYYVLMLVGMVPVVLFNVFAQWSYGIGDTRRPMWIILIANVINVVGNYALIFGHFGLPEMGLVGAGISTLASRVFTAVAMISIFAFRRQNAPYRQGFASSHIDGSSMRQLWNVSLPISLQMTFESGSFSAAAIMTGWISAIDLAAFQIIVIVGTLGFCIYYSIGAAITILVANEAGRNDTVAMRRIAWSGYHILLTLMTISSLIFIFFGRTLMSVFTDDSAVLAVVTGLIFPLVLYQAGDATQINFASALRGTSRVMPMVWIAFVSYVIVGMPATYILAFPAGMGSYGVILSFSVSLFLAGALFLIYFLRATRDAR